MTIVLHLILPVLVAFLIIFSYSFILPLLLLIFLLSFSFVILSVFSLDSSIFLHCHYYFIYFILQKCFEFSLIICDYNYAELKERIKRGLTLIVDALIAEDTV